MNSLKIARHTALFVALVATGAMANAVNTAPPAAAAASPNAVQSAAESVHRQGPASAAAMVPSLTTKDNASDAPAGDAELDSARGGASTTVIDSRIAGQVSGNSASNVQTGWNIIDGGAFANMTGIPIIVQNSGANVLIQNATVIQIQLQ